MATTKQRVPLSKPTTEQSEAARKVQAIVREFVPEGISLADEIIAERRADAERE